MCANKFNNRMLQSQNTKKVLFNNAKKLIKDKGYYNVSIQEITNSTNLSVGAFYHHFKNKDELVLLWVDDLDLEYSKHYEEIKYDPKYKNSIEKIKDIIFFSLETYSFLGNEFTEVSYSYMMREPKASAKMLDANRSYFKIMNELVEDGKIHSCIRLDIDTDQIIKDIVMVTRGAILDWCINGDTEDIRSRSITFVNCYIDGISLIK